MARRDYTGNAVPTTLSAGINATDLSISITSATGWPSGGASGKFYVTVDRGLSTEERILIASRTGTTLTISAVGDRGVDDTTAASHSSGAIIEHTFSSVDADEANAHVNDAGLHLGAGQIDDSAMFAAGVVDAAAIAANAVGSSEIAADAVGTSEIAADAVGTSELGPDAVTSAELADNAVGAEHIQADSVGTSELAPDSVTATEIAANGVGTTEIADNAVTQAKMADNSVGAAEIIADSVGTSEIAPDAVTTAEILAGTILGSDLADAIITMAKMASEAGVDYVPTLTGVTLGTGGTKYGRYFKFGRLIAGWAGFELGTGASEVTASIQISIPFAAANAGARYIGAARGTHSASRGSGMGVIEPGESVLKNIGTFGAGTWDASVPWDWDDGDTLISVFFYEAAA